MFNYFRCKNIFYENYYSMSTRHESLPIPNLPDYAFGERIGAGSYGKDFLIHFQVCFYIIDFRNCI